jgi:hypothetical protein
VFSHEKKNEKPDSMHANPVNRGLVRHPQDWFQTQYLLQPLPGTTAEQGIIAPPNTGLSWRFYFRSESGLIAMDPVNM